VPKVYAVAAGTRGQEYKAGTVFEVTAWRDGGATEPEQAQDLSLAWVDVLSVFVVDNENIVQNSYDFLELVPQLQF